MIIHIHPDTVGIIKEIPVSESIAFDIREWKNIEYSISRIMGTKDSTLKMNNALPEMFQGKHNRYFIVNDKDYWFNVRKLTFVSVNDDRTINIECEGAFVSKDNSTRYCTGKDTSSYYKCGNFFKHIKLDTPNLKDFFS